ncbi:MAG: acyltransferase [Bacteroidetes bacterium]|nr:acyltransferase [Bacteroidota bacterium]
MQRNQAENKSVQQFSAEKIKPHFLVLDGMRGVAAFAIVLFHFMEWIYTNPAENFIGHGFLAVDFFFCLSGFVIGYAYDDRLKKIGLKQFFKRRFIRLQPLVVFGSVIGLLAFLFDPFAVYQHQYSLSGIALIFLCSVLMVPLPTMSERAFNLFGLNAPSWSLFWEYVANIFYGFVLVRLHKKFLLLLLLPAAYFLFHTAYEKENLLGGWTGENFWDGGIRIWYSFLAGLIIYRYKLIIKNNAGFFGCAILLSIVFVMPHFNVNWLAEFFVVALYFPLIVALGAGTALSQKTIAVCKFSGDMSYPLYMTHYAGIWIFGNYFTNYHPEGVALWWIVISGTTFLIMFAWIVMKYYDIPVRKWLSGTSGS